MDKTWSDMNRDMQALISKKATFDEGMEKLLELRASVFGQIGQIVDTYPPEAFWAMPFKGAAGYHSKTLAYSVWHIFRIEDIVAHEMIAGDEQVLFREDFLDAVGSPIITTGNELTGDAVAAFSQKLNVKELYRYAQRVKSVTDELLRGLTFSDLKRRFGEDTAEKLRHTGCVSEDESAAWLIPYWCVKDVLGLIRMPLSRHWIMHVEAMRRIKNRLCADARKGADPVAFCGLSCAHCFLGAWCGSCRTEYNTCSFAKEQPDGQCPNAACCREKGIDGCWECDELEKCEKGFYVPSNDGAGAAKAQAMYIRSRGKKAFLKLQARLHAKYDFSKVQEILGQDPGEGLRILEEN